MDSPYVNTKLYTTVTLHPDQMDNKIYINLKKNLEKDLLNKCFRNYGCIMDIFELVEYNNGVLEAENLMASALFKIAFTCRLCRPLKNRNIIAQVHRVNKVLITLENGPILIIITNDRINDKIFFSDNNNNLRYKIKNESKVLKPNEFVKITIVSLTFNNGDSKIKAIGFLDDMATEEEIKTFYKDQYDNSKELQNFEDYVKQETAIPHEADITANAE